MEERRAREHVPLCPGRGLRRPTPRPVPDVPEAQDAPEKPAGRPCAPVVHDRDLGHGVGERKL